MVSKTVRFEVFKRDNFTCQYCGSHPPAVILELDHITPSSKGGNDSIDNLLTSCFDCNRGKGARELSNIPATVIEKTKLLREREEQISAFNALLVEKRARENESINQIQEIFSSVFEGYEFKDKFRESIRYNFLQTLAVDQCCRAMLIAVGKMHNPERALKYFCGVCWRWIRDGEQ